MTVGERILLSLSRAPGTPDYYSDKLEWEYTRALSLLDGEYPGFAQMVVGKRIVDFGCGTGLQAIALANICNCSVVGLDTNKHVLDQAVNMAASYNAPSGKVTFIDRVAEDMRGTFDVVISQNSFEHFRDPTALLGQMTALIKESGKIFITFGPPWLSPYGSHMRYFCRLPWIHIVFSEKTVMKVRARFRNDGAQNYGSVESGLNQMTVQKFESIIKRSGLKVEYIKYGCVKGINILSRFPVLREFFINHISVILSKNWADSG